MANEHTSPREHLKELHGKKKLLYLWNYYKLHFLLLFIALYVAGSFLYGRFTRKENLLYVAAINVELSDTTTSALTTEFVDAVSETPKKEQVYLYENLFLSDSESADVQYVAASRMKILATIDAEELDVIITSKEVLDAFEEKGYLSTSYELVDSPIIKAAGYTEPVYLGIIANSPRTENAERYYSYLMNK